MKTKHLPALGALLLALGGPLLCHAQAIADPAKAPAAQPVPFTDGEIRKLDLEGGKATIKHGEIRNLDMPPMTMVFTAKDRSQLAGLKPGDKVRFRVLHEAGQYLLTDIQAAK
jgi:Cu(I)/Ag(I) efflux system protein CusF